MLRGGKMRRKGRRQRIWWWAVLALILVLAGYFTMTELGNGPGREETGTSPGTGPSEQDLRGASRGPAKGTESNVGPLTQKIPEPPPAKVDPCDQAQKDLVGLFQFHDGREYVQRILSNGRSYVRFKEAIKRLTAQPPMPAGESMDPAQAMRNTYYFFRSLKRDDLSLARALIENEEASMELDLEVYYRWLMPGDRCPDPEGIRPPFSVSYRYAGFFLNTIGGRAYLYRRSEGVRLLVSYYCLLILSEADKRKVNTFGIDVRPLIGPILSEMDHYPGFQFRETYLEKLKQLEAYYRRER
jgi:hypothetical protein